MISELWTNSEQSSWIFAFAKMPNVEVNYTILGLDP